jgi:hypothetical protein
MCGAASAFSACSTPEQAETPHMSCAGFLPCNREFHYHRFSISAVPAVPYQLPFRIFVLASSACPDFTRFFLLLSQELVVFSLVFL